MGKKDYERILVEDALKHIYKCQQEKHHATGQSVAGALQISHDEAAGLITTMAAHNLAEITDGKLCVTPAGNEYALQIIRAHRLWERYLADKTGFDQREWHERADRHEHALSPAEADALSARLGHPTHDPHGDPIPTAEGELKPHDGQPLPTIAVNQSARIVHLEDEPATVYDQLIAEGLYPGMEITLTENSPRRIRFVANGETHTLAPIIAANVSVTPIAKKQLKESGPAQRLSTLKPGQKGQVVNISPACRGPERRRFMDLGILPGTVITAEMRSPGGDPTAYNVRGSLIALRREQADFITISQLEEA